VVGAAARVKTQVVPVTEVVGLPNRNTIGSTASCGSSARTGKCREIVLDPLLIGERDVSSVCADAIVACLVVVAVDKVWL
jgi:hypothetical protein